MLQFAAQRVKDGQKKLGEKQDLKAPRSDAPPQEQRCLLVVLTATERKREAAGVGPRSEDVAKSSSGFVISKRSQVTF